MENSRKPYLRHWLKITAIVVLPFVLLTLLLMLAGNRTASSEQINEKIHQVDVLPLETQSGYSHTTRMYGRIEAAKTARLGFEYAGRLADVLVDEGELVEETQVLARLDTQRLHAQLRELGAMRKRAEADVNLATATKKRVIDLKARKLESQQQLDEAIRAVKAAQAHLEEVDAQLMRLRIDLQKSTLIAPFSGYVVTQNVDNGSVVGAGDTVFTLQNREAMEARFAMPANIAGTLEVGQAHTLYTNVQAINGVVKSIARIRNTQTRTVDVIFALLPTSASILPGDLLAFDYLRDVPTPGVWVPKDALKGGIRGLWTLYTVDDDKRQQINAKSVKLIHSDETRAFVSGVFMKGELVVTSGIHRLVPNQTVFATRANSQQVAWETHDVSHN